MEFTPLHKKDQDQVLWNRTDPQTHKGGRGQIKYSSWEIKDLTQADNGHYTLWKKDKSMESRTRITVEGDVRKLIEAACELLDCCVSD